MSSSSFRRASLPYRKASIAAMGPFHPFLACAAFSVRHLPRLARNGWSSPLPPLLKRSFLHGIAKREGMAVLVETETYLCDTSWWLKGVFSRIHTIEVDPFLCAAAGRRFSRFPHVSVHLGDSSAVLPSIITGISQPALYWLDGHYSAGITGSGTLECPVMAELDAIYELSTAPFIIVIDDARCFGQDPAYPSMTELRQRITDISGGQPAISVENDMIIIRKPMKP